ncbi:unnamed protein product [Caenorhabditis nigoni]
MQLPRGRLSQNSCAPTGALRSAPESSDTSPSLPSLVILLVFEASHAFPIRGFFLSCSSFLSPLRKPFVYI